MLLRRGLDELEVSLIFLVNVTQTSYQAEENQDITLEWTFTTNPHISSTSLNIFCELLTVLRPSVLFHLYEGIGVPESQDEQFAGRVQWDKDVLREGRLRLHVSRLRTEDSGLYKCQVATDYGRSSGRYWLNVTARDRPEPETLNTTSSSNTTSPPRTESPGWIVLYCGLALTAAALLAAGSYWFRKRRTQREHYSPPEISGYRSADVESLTTETNQL
ncbi:uncharacterized protein LOC117962053 isoform X2 [Etheostoma cragini]|uniref:uncharacterized protein LOC117962053 isoform X2 n=1 Tax=Etheostoma cragini TaxID=417921 RepID=UPI00155DFF97|nr:uncharacterized protein LOC117962053 isoform X2 [Etheostoma cragini]